MSHNVRRKSAWFVTTQCNLEFLEQLSIAYLDQTDYIYNVNETSAILMSYHFTKAYVHGSITTYSPICWK